MNIVKLSEKLKEFGEPKFRLEQIQKAIFQDGISSWDEISTISKELREKLKKTLGVQEGHQVSKEGILSFEIEKVLEAKDGQSVKALLRLKNCHSERSETESKNLIDNKSRSLDKLGMTNDYFIETVLISPKPNVWSACISCQVGCQMGCQFCATGKMGFKRDLTAEEITDQVLFWAQHLKTKNQKLSTIVYMGMGEPFLNWENVSESLKNLINPKLFGFGSRSISISTSGVPEGIEKLAEEFPQINLALSLHFADDQKRSQIMPINRKNNLEALKKSLQNYFTKTKRKVFLEYVMLEKINDSHEDADKLVRFVKSIGKLQLLHVNLIRYNATNVISTEVEESNLKKVDPSASLRSAQDDKNFKSSSKERTMDFKNFLLQNHIPVTIRKSLGEEIQGACGQLSVKN